MYCGSRLSDAPLLVGKRNDSHSIDPFGFVGCLATLTDLAGLATRLWLSTWHPHCQVCGLLCSRIGMHASLSASHLGWRSLVGWPAQPCRSRWFCVTTEFDSARKQPSSVASPCCCSTYGQRSGRRSGVCRPSCACWRTCSCSWGLVVALLSPIGRWTPCAGWRAGIRLGSSSRHWYLCWLGCLPLSPSQGAARQGCTEPGSPSSARGRSRCRRNLADRPLD